MPRGRHKGFKHSPETKRKMSKSLKGKRRSPEMKRKLSDAQKGDKNGNWKGGRRTQFGYIWIWCPSHPYARHGCVLEHRLVMEAHLGRMLLPTEVVHHINGIKDDNRIENLMLFSDSAKHQRHHRKMKRDLSREFHASLGPTLLPPSGLAHP